MDYRNEELSRLSDLIDLIYEGATDPGRWEQDILPAVAAYIQAPECILFTTLHTPQNGGYFFLHGIAQDHVDLYMNKYLQEDVWTLSAIEKNMLVEGQVVLGEELVPREQLLSSRIYKECLSRDKNMAQLMTSVVFGMTASHSMPVVCSFFRGLHHPTFGEEDRTRMQLLLPHLSRSLGVMQRLRTAELSMATSLAALNRLPSGVLLMNDLGTVAFANQAAQRMLADEDGLLLRKTGYTPSLGNLLAQNADASSAISAAISATLSRTPYDTPHFSKCVCVPRPSGLASYTLQFSALGEHNEFGSGSGGFSTIIFITDGAKEIAIDPALLQSAYGLSPAEARVAVALLASGTVQDVADRLGSSPHTVRSQIKQVYAKLGVDTRARFVKLLLGLVSHR